MYTSKCFTLDCVGGFIHEEGLMRQRVREERSLVCLDVPEDPLEGHRRKIHSKDKAECLKNLVSNYQIYDNVDDYLIEVATVLFK